jgi:AAA ATPase domain
MPSLLVREALRSASVERLLEREEELETLARAVDSARGGRGMLVLVAGEAGIGKTSLLRALRVRFKGRATFLVGACEPLSVPVPLAPIRELVLAAGVDALAELGGDDRLGLARSLLAVLGARAPAVAVVEDAHWADPATLDVIRLLGRRVEEAGVVIIVSYRDDELVANQALTVLVGDLATSPTARRVSLRPLSGAAVRVLSEPAGIDSGELSRVTGGNPFLVVESLAAGGGLPASVRDATLARVRRLGASARGVVDAAAVIGQRVPVDLLAAIAPNSSEAVEGALACGVLTQDGGSLGFRHELIRQAVEASISAPRRAELHARVVAALPQRAESADHALLAHHAERAGLATEASHHASLAAADAERVGALREAGLQLERALRVGTSIDTRERFELLVRFARATNFEGRMGDALRAAQEAVEIAERDLGAREHGRALNVLVAALWSLDRVAAAKEAAQAAIALLETTSELAELARAHGAYLRVEAVAFDPAVVIAAAPRALDLAAAAGLEEARIDIEISHAVARARRGDPGARALLVEALADARAARLHLQTIRAYVNMVAAAVDARDHATVDAVSACALSVFDDYQAAIPRDAVTISLALSLLDRGRWDEALQTAARGRREWFGEVPLGLVIEGIVRARRRDPDGESLLDRALEGMAARDDPRGARRGGLASQRSHSRTGAGSGSSLCALG